MSNDHVEIGLTCLLFGYSVKYSLKQYCLDLEQVISITYLPFPYKNRLIISDFMSKLKSLIIFIPSFGKKKFAYKGVFGVGHVLLSIACYYLGYELTLYVGSNEDVKRVEKDVLLNVLNVKVIKGKKNHTKGPNLTWKEDRHEKGDVCFLVTGFDYELFIKIWSENIRDSLIKRGNFNFNNSKRLWIACGTGVMGESWVRATGCKVVVFGVGSYFSLEGRSRLFIESVSKVIQGPLDYKIKQVREQKLFKCNNEFEYQMISSFSELSQEGDFFLNSSIF